MERKYTRSLISLSPTDRKPARPNMRKNHLDLYDLQAQLRGDVDPDERTAHNWATSWWVPVIVLTGVIGLVVFLLHVAA